MANGLIDRYNHGPVVLLTLNRPERRNALSRALIATLSDELTRIETDTAVRSVVLSGVGTTFCSGMDLRESEAASRDIGAEAQSVADLQAIADLIQQVHHLGKPTIAALNGDAFAGGAGLAVACDFVIAAKGAKIGYPEVRRGLVAAIVMHDLVYQIGERRARALLLSGEPINVEEAERLGTGQSGGRGRRLSSRGSRLREDPGDLRAERR